MSYSPLVGSVLSLDIGRSRIGIAGCDPMGITITPLPALARKKIAEDVEYFQRMIAQRRTIGLLIGIPLDDSHKITAQSIHCRRYGKKLAKELQLPVAWINEHSSSRNAAEHYNLSYDKSGHLDSMVAYMLLEQWLSERREFHSTLTIARSFT